MNSSSFPHHPLLHQNPQLPVASYWANVRYQCRPSHHREPAFDSTFTRFNNHHTCRTQTWGRRELQEVNESCHCFWRLSYARWLAAWKLTANKGLRRSSQEPPLEHQRPVSPGLTLQSSFSQLLTYVSIDLYNLLNAARLHEWGGDPLFHS